MLEARSAGLAAALVGAASALPEVAGGAVDPLAASAVAMAIAGTVAATAVGGLRQALAALASFAEQTGREDADEPPAFRMPELRRLSQALVGLSERLAREEHARASFIGRVSHELRTPITVIKGYAFSLQRSERDPATAARLAVIDAECERLAYLVEDLLELSRAQAGELRISSELFQLRRCVEEVTARLRPVAEDRGVDLELLWDADGARVMGDENRVRQIFANLVTNGIKHSPPGSRVVVRGGQEQGLLVVSVADNGSGIAEGDLPHIFEEFFQGSEHARPGAGLGLAIARELTEAHGGTIGVDSTPGCGATFRVALPVWQEV